jgi:hypothetical protein
MKIVKNKIHSITIVLSIMCPLPIHGSGTTPIEEVKETNSPSVSGVSPWIMNDSEMKTASERLFELAENPEALEEEITYAFEQIPQDQLVDVLTITNTENQTPLHVAASLEEGGGLFLAKMTERLSEGQLTELWKIRDQSYGTLLNVAASIESGDRLIETVIKKFPKDQLIEFLTTPNSFEQTPFGIMIFTEACLEALVKKLPGDQLVKFLTTPAPSSNKTPLHALEALNETSALTILETITKKLSAEEFANLLKLALNAGKGIEILTVMVKKLQENQLTEIISSLSEDQLTKLLEIQTSPSNETLLHKLAELPNGETILEQVIEKLKPGQLTELLNKTNQSGDTPLYLAVMSGKISFLKIVAEKIPTVKLADILPKAELPNPTPLPDAGSGRIDIDTHDWKTEQDAKYTNGGKQKLASWGEQVRSIQNVIGKSADKVPCGYRCIAEIYVQSFFPEITLKEYVSKITEIEQILTNGGNEQVNHRTLTAGIYGNEDFFNQVSGPLRQLIADTLDEALEHGQLDLTDNAAVQAFFEKIVIFSATARGTIAAVAGSDNTYKFGNPVDPNIPDNILTERFSNFFSESQTYLARWLTSDVYPASPYDSNPEGHEALKLGDRNLKESDGILHENQLGYGLDSLGNVQHAAKNMLFIGDGLFKECMEEAKRLKENPDDPEARRSDRQDEAGRLAAEGEGRRYENTHDDRAENRNKRADGLVEGEHRLRDGREFLRGIILHPRNVRRRLTQHKAKRERPHAKNQ